MILDLRCDYTVGEVSILTLAQAASILHAHDRGRREIAVLRTPRRDWTIHYDYPCAPHEVHHADVGLERVGPTSATVGDLLHLAALDYVAMYATTTAIPRPPSPSGIVLMNAHYPPKGPSNPHGIAMHCMDDLVFEGITIDLDTGRVDLIVGS
jgi:hypothetical protein